MRLDDRLPSKDITLIAGFIDAGELGLALEQVADVLSEDERPLSADERAVILALVHRIQMDERVRTPCVPAQRDDVSHTSARGRWHVARTAAEADFSP